MNDLTTGEAKERLERIRPGEWTLLDVRQPWEYEEFHIPGAQLIPLSELPDRVSEVDPDKPVLVYCHAGGRSLSAAQYLEGRGHPDVYNLLGGASAWNGLTASGPIRGGLEILSDVVEDSDALLIGYGMEAFLQEFYMRMAERAGTDEARALYLRLQDFEDGHKDTLYERYRRTADSVMERADFDSAAQLMVAEGGVDPESFAEENGLALNTAHDIVSMAMMFEAQAFDFYTRASRAGKSKEMEALYLSLAAEERAHLRVLANFLDSRPKN